MLRRRLSYANVMSTLGVFIALGGTSYAVTQLPRNSVGSNQLKSNSVTSAKIRDRAVRRADLAPSARVGSRGPRGATGPAGAAGPAGAGETVQSRKPNAVQIPPAANGSSVIASLTLQPGTWLVNARTRLIYNGGAGSDYFDCDLRTATGTLLQRASARLGQDAQATEVDTVTLQFAETFAAATQVVFTCAHNNVALPAAPFADQANLLATRLTNLEDR